MTDRQLVSSASPFESAIGFSRAVRVGDLVAVSGTAPISDDGAVYAPGDLTAQTRRCLQIALSALAEAGGGKQDVIRTRIFLTDASRWQEAAQAHGDVFADVRPAATMVSVASLLDPGWLVEIELDAVLGAASPMR